MKSPIDVVTFCLDSSTARSGHMLLLKDNWLFTPAVVEMWGFRYPQNCVRINACETQHMPKHTALQQGPGRSQHICHLQRITAIYHENHQNHDALRSSPTDKRNKT